MVSVQGKVTVITGASRGIGKATALLFAKEKAKLALCARSKDDLSKVARDAEKIGTECYIQSVDVREEAQVNRFVSETQKRLGTVDVLINNAGVGLYKKVAEMTTADWDGVLDVNLKGVFFFSRAVIPVMQAQQSGQIINVVSGAGRTGIPNLAAYCASKFGLLGFGEALALELRPYNIKVSSILPGSVDTEWSGRFPKDRPKPNPLPVKLTPEEVAEGILFLCQQNENAWTSELNLRPHKVVAQ